MRIETLPQLLWLLVPLSLVAFAAGALRAAGLRQRDPRRRRLLQVLWVVLLLVVGPLWLFAAASLRLI